MKPEPTALPFSARLRLRAAIFIAGACVMILQVLGTRIIGPHYGVGLYVWTALIAVTLVALALGYWLGGKLADRHPSLLWFAAVLLVAAAAVGLIPLLRGWILEAGWHFGLRGGALLSASVLFFPSLFFLGMVSPYAVRLEATGAEVAGRSAGRLYAISTTGSVAGALLAGFYLVPHFRVPSVLAAVAVTLIVAAAREHFGLTLLPSKVHAADGRVFLRENPGRFDVVVLDAFSGDRLAYTLVSREGWETAKSALAPGGLLALNTWGIDP